MKKLFLTRTLTLASFMAGVLTTPLATAQSDVSLSGRILIGTCQVDTAGKSLEVNLGRRQPHHFPKIGDGSDWVPFTLSLQRCNSEIRTLDVRFDGLADAYYGNLFQIDQGPGNATGIGVNIRRMADNNDVRPGIANTWTRSDFNGDYEYRARYVRTNGKVGLGRGTATVMFTLSYR